jgi:uncharacterized protein YndB with AHSA1/START domain
MASAERELLASPGEVWAFLAEPTQLADWWPGVVAVEPDRRGFAAGARWRVERRDTEAGLLRLPSSGRIGPTRVDTLVTGELVPERRWSFELVASTRVDRSVSVSLSLAPATAGRTLVTVEVVSRRGFGAGDRRTARAATERLYGLLQTSAAV